MGDDDASTSGANAFERELMAMTEAFTVEDASEPLSFASWNANGLLNRLRDKSDPNGRRTRALLALSECLMRKRPDVIALQEVWLKCEEIGKGRGEWCER
jgi:hypothetical protein